VAAAAVAVALAARLSVPVPGTDVPQSLQTLAVLLVGCWLGAPLGALALVVYVLAGGVGVPVFADGASGWSHLLGSSGGYLAGFVVGAAAIGLCADRGLMQRVTVAFTAMLAGHALILACGWAWLAQSIGAAAAFSGGVAPFLWGGLAKSLVGCAIAVPLARWAEARAA
jgi:biotin transport system substrate-specific component